MLSPLTIVWPTEVDCNRALSDFVTYRLSHGLGLLDALIAASAVGMSIPLCTFNNKHYKMMQRLKTVQPYER
jgi:predicted nucleic acid-binding protein